MTYIKTYDKLIAVKTAQESSGQGDLEMARIPYRWYSPRAERHDSVTFIKQYRFDKQEFRSRQYSLDERRYNMLFYLHNSIAGSEIVYISEPFCLYILYRRK